MVTIMKVVNPYDLIERLNKLYDEGNEIHYWTARGARPVKIGQSLLKGN